MEEDIFLIRGTPVFGAPWPCQAAVNASGDNNTLGIKKQVQVSEAGRRDLMERFVALGGGQGYQLNDDIRAKLRDQLAKIFTAAGRGNLWWQADQYQKGEPWFWVDTLMKKVKIVDEYFLCR